MRCGLVGEVDALEVDTVIAVHELFRVCIRVGVLSEFRDNHGLDCLWLSEFVLEPATAILVGFDIEVVSDAVTGDSFEHFHAGGLTAAGGNYWMQILEVNVFITEFHSDHSYVLVELFLEENLRDRIGRASEIHERPSDIEPFRQFDGDWFSALDFNLSPDELLHRVLVLDPRAAGLAPTRRASYGHLHPEAVG